MAIITCEMIILYDFYTYTIIKKFTLIEIFKMLFSNIFISVTLPFLVLFFSSV